MATHKSHLARCGGDPSVYCHLKIIPLVFSSHWFHELTTRLHILWTERFIHKNVSYFCCTVMFYHYFCYFSQWSCDRRVTSRGGNIIIILGQLIKTASHFPWLLVNSYKLPHIVRRKQLFWQSHVPIALLYLIINSSTTKVWLFHERALSLKSYR